ncbi:NUDIX hydrolase [Micromonospora sp. CB01531]|uniref:NUDIX hydrolase n=1 Tax=Micromonospora sp. CB01531 TaxID=1718947 RepID=UPI0009F8BD4B
MPHRGPWDKLASERTLHTPHFDVYRDQVRRPDGSIGHYDWVAAPDQVRVVALAGDSILLIDQYHYLAGQALQLPGGSLERGEESLVAARRELQQETGFSDGTWTNHGSVRPLPGLTTAQVHLWSVRNITEGPASPESAERDLRVVRLTVQSAEQAALDGKVECAASAALILRVTAGIKG